jgi:hypothetical protein
LDAQLFGAMVQMGLGEQDNSAVIAIFEAMAGVHLAETEQG